MVDAQKTVKEYVTKMEAYIACLDEESKKPREEPLTDAEQKIHVQRHNAAVDAMQALADQYNAEVRAYKTAQDEAKY
jgi:hypothetical protein